MTFTYVSDGATLCSFCRLRTNMPLNWVASGSQLGSQTSWRIARESVREAMAPWAILEAHVR